MASTGDKVVAIASQHDTQNTSGTTTSTSYTATLTGGTTCGVAFIAPPSGLVLVHFSASLLNSGANFSIMSFEVRTGGSVGSGTVFLAADDSRIVGYVGTGQLDLGRTLPVSGLTAGSTYNARQMFRVTAGTGTFLRKNLTVSPQV